MPIIEINESLAEKLLPERDPNGNKGTFGRVFSFIGSANYVGACHLATEAMLRGGAGYTVLASEDSVIDSVLQRFPEVIFKRVSETDNLRDSEIEEILKASASTDATLIGCGSGTSISLKGLTERLIETECDSPLIIDADAINSIARYSKSDVLKKAKRQLVLTPHPLEFSRLSNIPVEEIEKGRIGIAKEFAASHGCILILKGHRTVITDGETVYLNTTGSSALAKGGSGDALAGLIASLMASVSMAKSHTPCEISALSCYVHGLAGDELSEVYSNFGVTPSDLPRQMAKILKRLEK